jgi:hypothetical protein
MVWGKKSLKTSYFFELLCRDGYFSGGVRYQEIDLNYYLESMSLRCYLITPSWYGPSWIRTSVTGFKVLYPWPLDDRTMGSPGFEPRPPRSKRGILPSYTKTPMGASQPILTSTSIQALTAPGLVSLHT